MCIAILNTKGVTLKRELLNNCWQNNGDGAGMLWSNDGKMEVFKEMKSFDTFYDKYLDVRKSFGKQNIVLHFRISTHGKINETNCHPFLVEDSLGFVHNGMIYNAPMSDDYSDTYMFNESILKKFKPGFEYDEDVLDLLADYIGNGSKLVFLNSEDDYAIVNEKAGHWNLGCWFSNESYKRVNSWVDYGGVRKQKSSFGYTAGYYGWGYNAYDSYGDYYVDDKPSKPKEITSSEYHCDECECKLYGINEINRGTCDWCERELVDAEKVNEDVCEYCECNDGNWDNGYKAYLCGGCLDELNGVEEVNPPIPSYREALRLSSQKEFLYNKEINTIECHTDLGIYTYDDNAKTYFYSRPSKAGKGA